MIEEKIYTYDDGSSHNEQIMQEVGQEEWDKMSTTAKNNKLKEEYGFYKQGKGTQDKIDEENETGVVTDNRLGLEWGVIFTFFN